MRQVGYLPELYEDARSEKYKISHILSLDYKISDTQAGEAGPCETPGLLARFTDL